MDLWVVAAAAGAGYLTKYFRNISKNGDSSSSRHLSSEDSYYENPEFPSCPFSSPKHARKGEFSKDFSLDRRASDGKSSDVNSLDGLSIGEMASNIGLNREKIRHFQNYSNSDVPSILNLGVSLLPSDDNFKNVEDGNRQSGSSAKVVPLHGFAGHNKTILRTKHLSGHISKPLNSLESCFMAQLYKEHAEMEEFVFSPLSSPSMTIRSFLVSNGNQIINRANDNRFSSLIGSKEYKLHKEAGQVEDENVFGVPALPKIGFSHGAKKIKFNAVIGQSRRLSSSDDVCSGKLTHTQYDRTFLFSLGISFGMIASIMANKREIDELRELLQQNENLVQDLQDELEMKDSMTVKELHNENYGSQDTCNHSFYDKELNEFSPEKHMDNSPRIDRKESYDKKAEQSSDSMSKIEAELEAELERLGLDMNASSLEGKLSELVEVDPDFVADFAQGELQADKVSGEDFVHPKSNEECDDTTPLPGTYAVLPHELSLRLHEVIQSQLEQRVKELEIALDNSQRKVRLMESQREDSNFQKESSFTKGNLLSCEDCDSMSQPFILNLSGEAVDAYNEAYEELIKINDSEENSPSGFIDNNHLEEGSNSHDWNALGAPNGSSTNLMINGWSVSRELSSSNVTTMLEGQSSSTYGLAVTGDESCEGENEVERQLIRQIVERTKKGSHVFENAQRILYSMDEDEH